MAVGTVKWFNDAKGYGFIQSEELANSPKDVFVHYSEIVKDGYKTLAQGQTVEFELADTPKGLQAKSVAVVTVDDELLVPAGAATAPFDAAQDAI